MEALGIGKRTIEYPHNVTALKGISFKIAIIPEQRPEQLRNRKMFSKEKLNEIVNNWGGVQIRYKGFRVFPYGDDDWLDLDKDRSLRKAKSDFNEMTKLAYSLKKVDPKRYLLTALQMRNHFGWVDIDNKAKGFQMKLNREGFIESDSFKSLKKVIRFGIHWSSLLRDYSLRIKVGQESEIARTHLEELTNKKVLPEKVVPTAIKFINQEIKDISSLLPQSKSDELKRSFANVKNVILKYDKNNQEQIHYLRLISATSTLVNVFAHEVKSLVGLIDKDYSNLKRIEKRLKGKDAQLLKGLREQLGETKERFINLLSMTALVGADSRKDYPDRISLYDWIEKACNTFELITRSYGIEIEYKSGVLKSILVGPILESELYAILLNILSNAIKAVIAGKEDKKIELRAIRSGNKIKINVTDSGIGLPESHWDHVMTAFVSDPNNKLYSNLEKRMNPEDNYIVGMGTGLGLSIVRDILHLRKGSISFVEPSEGWSTNLEILLP